MSQRYRFHNHGNELIDNIQRELGFRFWPKYRLSGVTFFGNKGRILKMVNNSKWLYFEFNVPVPGLTD